MKIIDKHLNFGRHIIKNFLKKISYKKILDIGAGTGEDLITAKKINPMCELLAIEIDKNSEKVLKDKDIKVFNLDLEKEHLPFKNEEIDIVIANQILEHTKEIFWIFHEICRVLKRNGYFIIGVPNLSSFHNRLLLLFGKQPSCIKVNSAHIRGFTKSGLIKFAKIGNLKLVDFKGSNFYPFPSIIAKPLSKIFPSLSTCIFFLFKKEKIYYGEFLEFPIKRKLATNFFLGINRIKYFKK